MAHEAEKQQLKEKITRLVVERFGGNFPKAFGNYDGNKDGRINKAELVALLKDAGIGNWLTRLRWADGILDALDTDRDGAISAEELEAGSN
jgi:Ca2+-binding EF-hand superfamily protein